MRTYGKQALLAAAALGAWLGTAQVATAGEISLVSGLYQSEDYERADKDAGGKTTISAGGRFAEQLDSKMFWFGQGALTLRSYDKGSGGTAPSDSTSLSLGGGVRYYFTKLAETVSPFAYGLGQYKSESEGEPTLTGSETHETNGLFYGASFGIRLSLGPDFFVDLETLLFESALFATEKVEKETVDPTTGIATKQTDETKRTDLYVNTTGAFQSMIVAIGMRI